MIGAVGALTRAQESIWIGQRLHAGAPLYNMAFTFDLFAPIDAGIFQRAFAALVAANDDLRTVIHEKDGAPAAVILPHAPAETEWVDLSAAVTPLQARADWVDARRARPFALAECLYDSALLKLADDHYVWYLCQHHIVTDVWTMQRLFQAMSAAYQIEQAGAPLELAPTPPYAAYRAHERAVRASEPFRRAETYWAEQLAHPRDPALLYSDRGASQTTHSVRRAVPIDARALNALAAQPDLRAISPDLTYSALIGALFLAFLHRLSGNDAIRLGAPFANRSAAFRQTFGLFMELLSLDVRFEAGETLRTLVKKVSTGLLRALQHLQPGIGSAAHNRAYNVLFNFIGVRFGAFAGLPTETTWHHAGASDNAHALRLQAHDFNGRRTFALELDFNTGAFTDADQARALRHFAAVIDACLSDPDAPVATIDLLTPDERAAQVVAFNATHAAYPDAQTVIELFEAQAARTPNAVALALDQHTMTYANLNRHANALAAQMAALGAAPGTLIPVCMEHSMALVTALVAILKAGAAYVPLDPAHPDARIAAILADIGAPPVIVTDPAYMTRFAAQGRAFPVVLDAAPPADLPNPPRAATPDDLAYAIYTSGTTGTPKGALIAHRGLTNYLWFARSHYADDTPTAFALYSSLAFDLTVTSIFVPLLSGGMIRIYPAAGRGGTVIRDVFLDNAVDVIKLTPSHLALVRDLDLTQTRIKRLIVGGEDFKTELAAAIHRAANGRIVQFNEYGPTEATVACMLHRYEPARDTRASVPIGTPSDNMRVYVLDKHGQHAPPGVIGELYLAGVQVARGYFQRPELTAARFLDDPFMPGERMYRTGDLARWLEGGELEFLGRADQQVKVGGARIELGEIEAALLAHPSIRAAAADVRTPVIEDRAAAAPKQHCARCGLESGYPGVTFDEAGVCSVCRAYDTYKDRAAQYFKDMDALREIAARLKHARTGAHDALVLVSGGKDSTYMLHFLVEELGLNVLAFTLDNGYISEFAKANIRRATEALGVEHVFGRTPFMNAIFADSLRQFANVCNGCFKTIYTLAVNLARERGIKAIFTGLSRGQFFETRLTEEVFTRPDFDPNAIDAAIDAMRTAYHRRDDLISRSLHVDLFRSDGSFEDIEFIDFYRYCAVDLSAVYSFLSQRRLWERPPDTGRSTNCLINEVGIYIHQQRRGFHNYALPYSWDVRMGHKTRDEALRELDDEIDPARVGRILREIGYQDASERAAAAGARLAAWFTADTPLSAADLREFLRHRLPETMLPAYFVQMDALPLTANGKVNRAALPAPDRAAAGDHTAPTTDMEQLIAEIWRAALGLPNVGIHDDFFALGGHSLPAIRIVARIERALKIALPLETFFAHPTVARLAAAVEDIVLSDDDLTAAPPKTEEK